MIMKKTVKVKDNKKVISREGSWLKVVLFLNGEYALVNTNQIFSIRGHKNGTFINGIAGNSVFVNHTVQEIEDALTTGVDESLLKRFGLSK